MTLIIGAKCKDGVVLIADKRAIEGTDVTKQDKIYLLNKLGVGFSGAGIKELFDKFLIRMYVHLEEKMKEYRQKPKVATSEIGEDDLIKTESPYMYANEFVEDCEGVMMKLRQDYNDVLAKYGEQLQVLIAFASGDSGEGAELHLIDISDCFDSRRKTYVAIGSGSPYAQIFLKEIWHQDITMNEMARLGCFIIHYIQSENLDNAVGDGVQVLYIPSLDNRYEELARKKRNREEDEELKSKYAVVMLHEKELVFPETDDVIKQFKESFDKLRDRIKEPLR